MSDIIETLAVQVIIFPLGHVRRRLRDWKSPSGIPSVRSHSKNQKRLEQIQLIVGSSQASPGIDLESVSQGSSALKNKPLREQGKTWKREILQGIIFPQKSKTWVSIKPASDSEFRRLTLLKEGLGDLQA